MVKSCRIKVSCMILVSAIFVSMGFFDIINSDDIRLFGIALSTICTIIIGGIGLSLWLSMKHLPNPHFLFGKWLVFLPIMILLSAFQSWFLLGQNILLGLIPQKIVFLWALLYFPIYKIYYYGYFTANDFRSIIKAVAIVQLILFILNYYLDGDLLFVGTGIRNGSIRYYYNPIVLDILFIISLDDFVRSKLTYKKIISAVQAALILFEVMVIQQFRLTAIGLIMCFGIFILMTKTSHMIKIMYLIIGTILFIILINTSMVQEVIELVFADSASPIKSVIDAVFKGTLTRSSLSIRAEARSWFIDVWKAHPILGGGQPNSRYELSQVAAGVDKRYYLVDVGVFGWLYLYGSVGIVWLVTFWRKLISVGWKLYKKGYGLLYLIFPLFCVITCVNELHWFWQNGFVAFCIFLLLDTAVYSNVVDKTRTKAQEQT